MKKVTLYTDGACSGNPGMGGWGCLLLYGEHTLRLSGGEKMTTNQRMELTAAIKGLQALNQPCSVAIYSDSAYLIRAFTEGWLANWQRNGWLNSKKQPVENKDLWLELLRLSEIHDVSWHKVKGHAGDANNEICDALAKQAIVDLS
ncbi:MAG: ribonuclease HI [Firmicutes bacterium]|nr:ribonuclease HI [Bacillota bacterium]